MKTVWYCLVCAQIVHRYDKPEGGQRELWCLNCKVQRIFSTEREREGDDA